MLIIAHRGARSTHPENTLSAIQAAMDVGAKAIEIDVHEHDGEFWVIHDKWLNRTTDHIGMLRWLSKEKLQKVDAGDKQGIPTLKQVLALISGQCALNIELKGIQNFELLYQHLEYASRQCQFQPNQIIISAFNHAWLSQIKTERPKTLIGALTASKGIDKAAFAQQINATSINLDLDVVDEDYVLDAKQRGLGVFVYTANQAEDWQWLEQIGVDGIFCDRPKDAIAHYHQPEHFTWSSVRE